jgi:hypothetical protein
MPIMKKLNQHQALLQSGQPLRWSKFFFAIIFVAANAYTASGNAVRIKEIAAVHGVRTNQLTGYGLVVGLDGTGDQTTQMPYTTQSLSNYLNQMGVVLPPGTTSPQLKNVAAVLVTAQLPAFAQPGQQMDVNVSSIGNAKSLKGGTLITTPAQRRGWRNLCVGARQLGCIGCWGIWWWQQGTDQSSECGANSRRSPGRARDCFTAPTG